MSYPDSSYRLHRAACGPTGDRLHEPVVFGSDYSVRPIPGQQALPLANAGYAESDHLYCEESGYCWSSHSRCIPS